MIRRSSAIVTIILLTILSSCRTARVAVSSAKSYDNAESYIENFKNLAISEMQRTGVPASITLAQGIIESDQGGSRLATEGNNHFGIKCHDDWKGPVVRHSDDRRNECFRKYRQPEESYRDHSDFLRSEQRYKTLFSLDVTDYKGWARGLKRAGYATNPEYANMLIRKIEEYNLSRYDKGISASIRDADRKDNLKKDTTAGEEILQTSVTSEKIVGNVEGSNSVSAVKSRVSEKNRIQYIIVREGDTPESLEKELQLLRWELPRYNELQPGFRCTPGQILYLQPKREKAEAGNDFHIVTEGQTMYMISQIYGIKLKSLLEMNRMSADQKPAAGQKLWLRSIKPMD